MFKTIEHQNIHNLAFESTCSPIDAVEQQYLSLQQTELYDPTYGQWLPHIGRHQALDADRMVADQLLGVVVESCFSMERAKDQYRSLHSSFRSGTIRPHWNDSFTPDQSSYGSERDPLPQLIGVWALSRFDEAAARSELDELKSWESSYWTEGSLENWASRSQSLGPLFLTAILENEIGSGAGSESFKKAQSSPLWSTDHSSLHLTKTSHNLLEYHTLTQLLGVIAETIYSPGAAPARFAALKKSSLYEKDECQWNKWLSDDGQIYSSRSSFNQLLGILAEYELAKLQADDSDLNHTLPLPGIPIGRGGTDDV